MEKTEFWHDAVILHHDNVHAYDFCPELLTECDHPPYLAMCNFWLYPKLKTALMSNRFSDIVNIQVCDSHPDEHSKEGIPAIFLQVETPAH